MPESRHALRGSLLVLAIAASPLARADWEGSGEAGLVIARGNTTSDTANLKLRLSTQRNQWRHRFDAQVLHARGEDDDNGARLVTAQRLQVSWQTDYHFTERAFSFGGVRYENDRFSGFDYQLSASSGIGYNLVETERTKLSVQIGGGVRQLRNRLTGEESRDLIARGDANFSHLLTETTRFTHRAIVEGGEDNTLITNESAIVVDINDAFALSAGYTIRYNTTPLPGLTRTDRLTTLNLVYKF